MTNCAQAYWDGLKMRDCSLDYGHPGDHERKRFQVGFISTLFFVGLFLWQIGRSLGWW